MTHAQHTPGPWSFSIRGSSPKVADTEGKAVCMVTPRKNAWNAHVIAEAPAMLEALRALLFDCEAHGLTDSDAHLREARAVLARIDGAGA